MSVTAVAAAVRIAGVGGPQELIFDETYYVKDAWTLLNLGYEGSWPDDPNPAFTAGQVDGYSDEGAFVAHPPFGKWIIALGMMIFGAESAFGWRFATAVVGTAMVPLLYAFARRITRSVWFAGAAAVLLALDPLAIAMSRVALLDTPLAFLVLLALWFALLDRPGTVAAIRAGVADNRIAGPTLWRRPWLLAAGITLGLATGVKWSGLYALAALGIAVVLADMFDRKRAGVERWLEAAIGRQAPASFVLLVPTALLSYLVTWTGWLMTTGGYDRSSSANPIVALWNYHRGVLAFHEGVTTPHTYASPAWEWILMLNPTLMYRQTAETCALGDDCVGLMAALPNPILWWAGMLSILWILVRFVRALILRTPLVAADGWVLVGVAGTFAPWLLFPERTMFSFYAITLLPFVILAVVFQLQRMVAPRELVLLNEPTRAEVLAERERAAQEQRAWLITSGVFVGLLIAVAVFYLPFGTGMLEPQGLYRAHLWLPGWFL
nr:phospholipid carrier-dependent glycosyltransferase [Microbacterium amylolyticum]